jgi:glycosyltransferase involved in cell wall biosynthesis
MNRDTTFCPGEGEPGLVSVVIPTYQRAGLIERAIDSVLAQDYRPVEVIVADDGSTDDTRARVERYGPPVRYLYQPNAGVSAARNLGLRAARGEFVALLDSDDAWLPGKLALQVAVSRAHPNVGMVWTDMSAMDDDGTVFADTYLRTFYDHNYARVSLDRIFEHRDRIGSLPLDVPPQHRNRPYYMGNIFSSMMLGNLVHTSTVLIRRERLAQVGLFDETLRVSGEDYEFHLRTCYYGTVALLDVPTILYRVGGVDQLTAPQYSLHMARNNLLTLDTWLLRAGEQLEIPDDRLRERTAGSHRWLGAEELRVGNHRLARKHLWKSLQLEPRRPAAWAILAVSYLPPKAVSFARHWRRRLFRTRRLKRPVG